MTLKGRFALVTGGNRGIGRAICASLAREGAAVAVHCRASRDEAESVVEEIRSGGGRAFSVQADVSVPSDVERMVRACRSEVGPVDILVNNARQLVKGKKFMELDWEADYRPQVDVMLKGAFLCCRSVLPEMMERGWGRIVNILSTVLGERRPATNAYGTVKSALVYFSQSLAVEAAPFGITVNMVSPGLTQTVRPILHGGDYRAEYIRRTPMGRLTMPEDVAEAVAYLASEGAAFVTGAHIPVAGGKVMF